MTIDCPHSWRHVAKFGSVTIEDRRINVYGGLCDSPDLCGIRTCEFFDDSREGTRRYNLALADAHASIEGVIADEEAKEEHERRRANGETFIRAASFEVDNVVPMAQRRRTKPSA